VREYAAASDIALIPYNVIEWGLLADLELAGGADVLKSHTDARTVFSHAHDVLKLRDRSVHPTDRGFAVIQPSQIADLRARRNDLSAGSGLIEMIPVVRVVARKPS
jgi:hypothetical protein